MPVDLPTVVIEAHAQARMLSSLSLAEKRALHAYSEATGIVAVELPPDAAVSGIALDPERTSRLLGIEETLKAARAPLDLGEKEALPALRLRVASAYAKARAHPEDPEAPYLVAEALRTLARIEDVNDPSGARALRARADVLDGGRRIGLSEGGPLDPPKEAPIAVTITLVDASSTTVVWIDGEERDVKSPIAVMAGEHHLRVVTESATLSAEWLTVTTPTQLTLRGGARRAPCSRTDLSRALPALEGFMVACPRWARVTPLKGAIEIRVCGPTSCGPAATWSTMTMVTPQPPHTPSVWSSRWTWLGIGAAALVGGTVTAWSLGAFDRPDKPSPVWRWDGAR